MKTTERILKELALAVLLLLVLGVLVRSIISYHEQKMRQIPQQDKVQMQDMKDFHRSQGRDIQLY